MSHPGILLDIDGTLLDSNHLHTVAWWRAFRSLDRTYPMASIHALIGMGGDRLVPELAGEEVAGAEDAYAEQFDDLRGDLTPLPGARDLVRRLAGTGARVVLASSAREEDLEHFRSVLDVDDWLTGATSSGDVDASKPAPEIFDVAIDHHDLDRRRTVVVGDTVWDAEAARRGDLAFVGVETGGTRARELLDAGAIAAYRDAEALIADLEGPLMTTVRG
jgi:HAD superfamily hydrolase (TIGR01549 family)